MGDRFVGKGLVWGIILLFIGLSITSITGRYTENLGNQLTKEIPANFTLNDGLLACWKSDQCNGTTLWDCSGHNYNGTIYGANWTPGCCLVFDGIDDYVDFDNHSVKLGYNKTDDYAIIVKFKSTASGMMYSTSHTDPARPYADLKFETDGKISFKTGDQSCLFDVTTANSYNNNQLHTVEVLFYGSTTNPTVSIYVDNTLDGTQTKWLCPILDTDFLTAKMGRESNAATDFYNGVIDVIKLYKYQTGNQPPNKPAMPSGEINGKVGTSYSYTTSTTDPDGDQVQYWFDWSDGNSGWILTNSASHTWTTPGTYGISVKARDGPMREESVWTDPPLVITITKNKYKAINTPFLNFLQTFIQNNPNRFPLLEKVLNLI